MGKLYNMFIAIIGISSAMQPIVACNFGAEKFSEVKETVLISIKSVTMFLLELVKLHKNYDYYTDLCKKLKDPINGKVCREYVGIKERIPDEVDMYNFRKRIAEERFQSILELLVELLKIVGIITAKVICTDGTLIQSFAIFRGCNYMDKCCKCLECPSGMFQGINDSIKEACLLIDKEDKRSKIVTVDIQCPRPEVIEKMKIALGYDYEYVYEQVRKEGAVPIIDYNFRNEKLTKEAPKNRGYDELGRPYAPCGKVCSPNGHDSKKKSVKYICRKRM